jgi:CheY-like chemotaxis protein
MTMWRGFKVFPYPETGRNSSSNLEVNSPSTRIDKELMSNLLVDLRESRTAAAAASKASEELMANLIMKFEGAADASRMEYNTKLMAERTKAKIALTQASNAADLRLSSQMLRYETAAAATAAASEIMIRALRQETENASKRCSDETESKLAIERFTSRLNSDLEIETAENTIADQRVKYKSAVFMVLALADASKKCELELAQKKAEDSADARVAAELEEYGIAAKSAKEEQDAKLQKMKLEYELASIAANTASEQTMETLKFKAQLATHFAMKQFDFQILSERTESKIAAKVAERANAVTLANQQYKYETAASAATEAYKSSMVVLREDSQVIIDAFNAEMVAKDLKYVVAKLSAERLEKQILTDRLEQAAASAQKESELLLSMCGNVAHDLKSPLHTLVLSIESLRSLDAAVPNSLSSEDLLDTLESACGFMRCAISRTIDFTEANSSVGLTPCKTAFNLQKSINTPVKWMRSMLPPGGGISLVLDPLPKEVMTIVSDQRWFEENLLCLLSNGVKYSSEGIVRIVTAVKHGFIRVTVEDNGIGIVAEERPKLFEQISHVQRMTVGGSGLGLYSLSKRSEAIGGACGVDDRSDGQPGSSFWFEVPYDPESSPPSISEETVAEETDSDKSSSHLKLQLPSPLPMLPGQLEDSHPLTVLVVDDSIAVIKILSNKLRSFGHRVETAKDGAEGLQKMISMGKELDLVIMDLQMPVMDGIEATRQYRAWESETDAAESNSSKERRNKRLPIICSSANCGQRTMVTAMAAGVDSFLPKPFDIAALSSALSEVTDSPLSVLTTRTSKAGDQVRSGSIV